MKAKNKPVKPNRRAGKRQRGNGHPSICLSVRSPLAFSSITPEHRFKPAIYVCDDDNAKTAEATDANQPANINVYWLYCGDGGWHSDAALLCFFTTSF